MADGALNPRAKSESDANGCARSGHRAWKLREACHGAEEGVCTRGVAAVKGCGLEPTLDGTTGFCLLAEPARLFALPAPTLAGAVGIIVAAPRSALHAPCCCTRGDVGAVVATPRCTLDAPPTGVATGASRRHTRPGDGERSAVRVQTFDSLATGGEGAALAQSHLMNGLASDSRDVLGCKAEVGNAVPVTAKPSGNGGFVKDPVQVIGSDDIVVEVMVVEMAPGDEGKAIHPQSEIEIGADMPAPEGQPHTGLEPRPWRQRRPTAIALGVSPTDP